MMRFILGNPYAIGGLALVFALLAAAAGVNHYRAKAAVTELHAAQAEAIRAQSQVSELTQRLYNVNQSLTRQRAELDSLRSRYETDAAKLRDVPDPTGCLDAAVPDDVGRLFAAPGQN